MKYATKKELEFIKSNYLTMTYGEIEKRLKRSSAFVVNNMKKLGLVVPDEVLKARKLIGAFKPGQTPMNKGRKQIEYMTPEAIAKTANTRFKKGQKPHNTAKCDGTITIRRDKNGIVYKYIRVGVGKWELLQRKIWADAHGKIPEGMLIIFKDGNQMNCELSNLEMISMADNMNRNTIQRFPPELKKAIRGISKLNKLITTKK
jgi:hypothetical protein